MIHIPVLQKEVIEYLNPKKNENFIDATIDGGGHTKEILKRNRPNGKVLGIELDNDIFKKLKKERIERLVLINDSYINLKKVILKYNFKPVNGILFDLGMSSWHLEESKRGFSFLKNETLDMRYDKNNKLTAEKIINNFKEEEIEKILKEYGEEKFSKRIAKEIINERKRKPIKTTFDLINIIKKAVPKEYQYRKIHFATKTFQALRIAVNDELNNLSKVLPETIDVLEKNGRLVIISFHSLEDRIVKNFLKENERKKILKILTNKPITAQREEIKRNKRSRSAKLRAAIKI